MHLNIISIVTLLVAASIPFVSASGANLNVHGRSFISGDHGIVTSILMKAISTCTNGNPQTDIADNNDAAAYTGRVQTSGNNCVFSLQIATKGDRAANIDARASLIGDGGQVGEVVDVLGRLFYYMADQTEYLPSNVDANFSAGARVQLVMRSTSGDDGCVFGTGTFNWDDGTSVNLSCFDLLTNRNAIQISRHRHHSRSSGHPSSLSWRSNSDVQGRSFISGNHGIVTSILMNGINSCANGEPHQGHIQGGSNEADYDGIVNSQDNGCSIYIQIATKGDRSTNIDATINVSADSGQRGEVVDVLGRLFYYMADQTEYLPINVDASFYGGARVAMNVKSTFSDQSCVFGSGTFTWNDGTRVDLNC
ncbi:hypothetical protein HDU97_003927 [Phlyctochytrium planicorne]|nr:hypothetical protein HDU97_003927 [Phlyctochytrium planicorne]